VRFLLDRKMEVNARSDSGMTGLMYAAEQGRAETVALLLRAGAIVNVESTIGCTPLMGAAFGTRKWPPVKTADDQPVRDPALAPDYLRIAERLSFHVTSII
jgi:ankyrin repeat protein